MYLVCDIFDNLKYGRIYNYKQLYELLVDEIMEDIKGNSNSYEIVVDCINQLGDLAKNNLVSEKYIIDNLQSYGWEIYNIKNIINDIKALKEFLSETCDTNDFDKVIELINKELKNKIKESE